MRRFLTSLALLAVALPASAQFQAFTVEVTERTDLANAPALHSGAFAEHDGLWLFVGGRTNGMHALGGDAFPVAFENGDVVVYDRETDTQWFASLDGLPDAVADPLSSTNLQYHQSGETLHVTGGYGWSETAQDFVTFGTWAEIDVPGLIDAVIAGTDPAPHIAQTIAWDDRLAVTGGHLLRLGGDWALVGGQRFDGTYSFSPSPSVQTYTEAVRLFDVESAALAGFREITDPELHRRDGNAALIALPPEFGVVETAIGIFGGVFTSDTLPYRAPLILSDDAGTPRLSVSDDYAQVTGHYTTPLLLLYSAETGAMHTVFFGGMNQFTWDADAGDWVSDSLIPFVDEISVLSHERDPISGQLGWSETFAGRLPALLGTNAYMALSGDLPRIDAEIVDLDAVSGTVTAGFIVGGIEADGPHPFWQPSQYGSQASARVLEVRLTSGLPDATEDEPGLAFRVAEPAPNPARDRATLALELDTPQAIRAEAFDATGRRVALVHDGPLGAGPHTLTVPTERLAPGVYVVRVSGQGGVATRRLVVVR